MDYGELLSAVQSPDGWTAVVGIKSGSTVQKLVDNEVDLAKTIELYLARKRDVYFGVAKYKTDENRKKPNVKDLKAFWLDIDCGADKAAKGDGYATQKLGAVALAEFCEELNLPPPTVIDSGRGIHAYWPLTAPITREEWEPCATRLRDLCVEHGLIIDPSVFEVARVLRVPGTLNFKDNPPSTVTVKVTGDSTSYEDFCETLGIAPTVITPPTVEAPPKGELTKLGQLLQDNSRSSFEKIMRRTMKNDGCQQLMDCFVNRATLPEPRWWDALSIAGFCVDKDTAIHKMSEGHPDYTPQAAEEKLKHTEGPHSCAVFERNNPGGCDGCPHRGVISNPIALGKEIEEAEVTDTEEYAVEEEDAKSEYTVPQYPEPFFRGKNGGIYKRAFGEEEEPEFVYPYDFYVTKRLRDAEEGYVTVFRAHFPQEGVEEFALPDTTVMNTNALRDGLAKNGVRCPGKRFSLMFQYVNSWMDELQFKKKAEIMRQQFGWADNDSKFIVGRTEVSSEGEFYSPVSSRLGEWADAMAPKGSFDEWKEVFNLYKEPGLEPHAFAALSAFGSPLLKFMGQKGCIINVIHPRSGSGKTTILNMCSSVWGNPEVLTVIPKDTANATQEILGYMNNLPFSVDEITNMTPAAFSNLVYGMSQGRGKHRMEAGSNKLRVNNTRWATISLASSNSSFYEKLRTNKGVPEGEMMRLIEYRVAKSDALPDSSKELFDLQLMQNYGHAGVPYARELVNNREEVIRAVLKLQQDMDGDLRLEARERIWSAAMAGNMMGGKIARRLKLMDWDLKRIYSWAREEMLVDLRSQVEVPAMDDVAVLGDFINRHIHNILVVNDALDARSKMQTLPVMEPKGELLIRYEPDTKKMFIVSKAFRNDCVELQINYRDTLASLEKRGVYIKRDSQAKRLTKGLKVQSPPVHCIEIDCSVPEFSLDIEAKVENVSTGD